MSKLSFFVTSQLPDEQAAVQAVVDQVDLLDGGRAGRRFLLLLRRGAEVGASLLRVLVVVVRHLPAFLGPPPALLLRHVVVHVGAQVLGEREPVVDRSVRVVVDVRLVSVHRVEVVDPVQGTVLENLLDAGHHGAANRQHHLEPTNDTLRPGFRSVITRTLVPYLSWRQDKISLQLCT